MELIHTCYRIGDIDRSVAFYEALGFEERRRMPIRDEAINVFMGLPGDGDRLELTYNHGVGSYELGTGYNHIAVTVTDLDGTLSALGEKGIEPEKPPYRVREGGARICFVRDPDGYRIERALETIELFAHFCRATRIERVRPLATSAIREASNRKAFVRTARERAGLDIQVLSREEEAHYGYLAVVNSTTLEDGVALDIGGGSMQLTHVQDRLAKDARSWRLGAVVTTERFLDTERVKPKHLKA